MERWQWGVLIGLALLGYVYYRGLQTSQAQAQGMPRGPLHAGYTPATNTVARIWVSP
jgi:hypothetical protein